MNEARTQVVLTRRRWDVYMIPLLAGTILIGGVRVWQTGQLSFALTPLAALPIWIMLRRSTPPEGMQVATIRATPGAIVMLWFSATAVVVMAALLSIDRYVFGHPIHAPLQTYHAWFFAPPMVILFSGAIWADRLSKSRRARNPAQDDDSTTASNDPVNRSAVPPAATRSPEQ